MGVVLDFLKFLAKATVLLVVVSVVGTTIFLAAVLGPRVMGVRETALECLDGITTSTFKQTQNSYILDADGEVLVKLMDNRDSVYLESYEIPKKLKEMVIAVEDKRYMEHNGVDLKAIGKALVELVRNEDIVRGGSTISQQLARNVFLNFDQTFDRKLCEMFISIELEKRYSKAEILEFYLNNICYGGNVYGIAAAADKYFSKSVSELTTNEMAYLVGIPQAPSRYNPLLGVEAGTERRNTVLKVLEREGVLTSRECAECLAEPIELNLASVEVNDYLASYAIFCGVEKLMGLDGFQFRYVFRTQAEYEAYLEEYEKAYSYYELELRRGGYEVYTSLDPSVQEEVQKVLSETLAVEEGLQGAVTVVQTNSGLPVAVVGGVEPSGEYSTFNRAFQAFRQPGSAIKPLVAYLPYLEQDGVTVNSQIPDREREDGIKNYDGKYWYNVSILKALQWSKNVSAVWCMEQIGIEECVGRLGLLGFRKIVNDFNPSAALGGLTYGVSTVEMANGYATIANGGTGRADDCIVQIKQDGKSVYRRGYEALPRVYEQKATEEVKAGLAAVLEGGTGAGFKIPEAWAKTGTTTSNKDSWVCGFDEDWTVAVWTGYDMPKTIQNTQLAGRVWKDTMLYLRTLEAPEKVVSEAEPSPVEPEVEPVAEPSPVEPSPVEPEVEPSPQESGADRFMAGIRAEYDAIVTSSNYNVIEAYSLLEKMRNSEYAEEILVYIEVLEEHLKNF